jgi:23S rRNA pseudouridine1911/1915/1917 synthase
MRSPVPVTQPSPLLPFLFAQWPETKKTTVKQWLKYGSVRINGQINTKHDHPLAIGDQVTIQIEKVTASRAQLPAGLKVHHEDDALLIIHKPENLLSIASEAEREKTAYFFLTDYVREGGSRPQERVWIVHRLDRETSGLMIFARTPEAKHILQSGWEEFEKRYLAVVEGTMKDDAGTIHSHLDETNPYKVTIRAASETTREAITHYKVLKRGQRRTLVELTLQTGRRHQIRVQLASLGHPIIGDEKYGSKTDPGHRLGLHSCGLDIIHPIRGDKMTFSSPLPLNLARLV